MNWVDWVIVALVGICTLHGVATGTLRQAFILMRILLALLLATAVHVVWLPPSLVQSGEALFPAGMLYGISLFVLYIMAWLALYLVFVLIKIVLPPISEPDMGQRLGGGFLGCIRGVALVFLLLILVDYSTWAGKPVWQDSVFKLRLSPVAQELRRGIMQTDDFTRDHIEQLMRTWQKLPQQQL